jgi:uncharacterized lipoprotein YajG
MGIDPSGNMSIIQVFGAIAVMGILMTSITGCSAKSNTSKNNNALLLYGSDPELKRSAEKIASRLGIPESNVIKVDSYGQFITILRQQKKSKGRIKKLFLHFHGHY